MEERRSFQALTLFDGFVLAREPDHYRRTPYEADVATEIIGLIRDAFTSGLWQWCDGRVRDERGWLFLLHGAFGTITQFPDEVHAHRFAIRYVAAVIAGSHAARSFYENARIVLDYSMEKGRTLAEIMELLTTAQIWADNDAGCL
jgi:hypothetical protein